MENAGVQRIERRSAWGWTNSIWRYVIALSRDRDSPRMPPSMTPNASPEPPQQRTAPDLSEEMLNRIADAFARSLTDSQRRMLLTLLPLIPGRPPELRVAQLRPLDIPNLIRNYLNVPRSVSDALNAIILQYSQEDRDASHAAHRLKRQQPDRPTFVSDHQRRHIRYRDVVDASDLLRKLEDAISHELPVFVQYLEDPERLWEGDELERRHPNGSVESLPVSRNPLGNDPGSPIPLYDARRIGIDAQTEGEAHLRVIRKSGVPSVASSAEVIEPSPEERMSLEDALDLTIEKIETDTWVREVDSLRAQGAPLTKLLASLTPEEATLEESTFFSARKLVSTLWKEIDPERNIPLDENGEIDRVAHDRATIAFQLLCQEAGLRSRLVDGIHWSKRRISRPLLWVEIDTGILPNLPRYGSGVTILVDPIVLRKNPGKDGERFDLLILEQRMLETPSEKQIVEQGHGKFCLTPNGVYSTRLTDEFWDHQRRYEALLRYDVHLARQDLDAMSRAAYVREYEVLKQSLARVPTRHLASCKIRRKLPFALVPEEDADRPTGISLVSASETLFAEKEAAKRDIRAAIRGLREAEKPAPERPETPPDTVPIPPPVETETAKIRRRETERLLPPLRNSTVPFDDGTTQHVELPQGYSVPANETQRVQLPHFDTDPGATRQITPPTPKGAAPFDPDDTQKAKVPDAG